MKLGRQGSISKLSKAIAYGFRMASERGIKNIKGELFNWSYKGNGKYELCGACALGYAAIAKFGTDYNTLSNIEESDVIREFNVEEVEKGSCLMKTLTSPKQKDCYTGGSVEDFVISLNDTARIRADRIADKLAKCDL